MTKLSVAIVALVTLGVGVSMDIGAGAATVNTSPQHVRVIERKLDWSMDRMHRLERRREYLHRYIKNLRQEFYAPAPAPTSTTATTPSTSTTSSSTTTTSSGSGWADELRAVGFPESAIPTMLGYIDRESGGDPSAVNSSSGACGLTQIYPAQPGCLDPMTNLRMAYAKYQAAGFSPWGG